jgi:hypothetical protein
VREARYAYDIQREIDRAEENLQAPYTPQEAYDHENPQPLDPPLWETER